MNETQRQLLADKINDLSNDIEREEEGIATMEARLARAKQRLADNKVEMAALMEGVDW